MIKYEGNFFMRFWKNIKNKFSKKEEENVNNNMDLNIVNKESENIEYTKDSNSELIERFEARMIKEEDLSEEEFKFLENHYKNIIQKLDEEILKKRSLLTRLKEEQIPYLEKAIQLKEKIN